MLRGAQERTRPALPARRAVDTAGTHDERIENTGVDEFWDTVLEHNRVLRDAGEFDRRRTRQQIDWMWAMVQ